MRPALSSSRHKLTNNKTQTERKNMNNPFDELTKNVAQSVTRRAALKKFGVGLAGMALAALGLPNIARADKVKTVPPVPCATAADCPSGQVCCNGVCVAGHDWCDRTVNYCCCYCVVPPPPKKNKPSY